MSTNQNAVLSDMSEVSSQQQAAASAEAGAGQGSVPPGAGAPAGPTAETVVSIIDLIRQISDGAVKAETIEPALRQECVHHLTIEGYSKSDIALLLRVSDRTIARDREAARKAHKLTPELRLGDELMGEFQSHTLASINRLVRLCNNDETPPYVRLWAEESIGRLYHRFVKLARELNYFHDGEGRLQAQYPPREKSKLELMVEQRLGAAGLL